MTAIITVSVIIPTYNRADKVGFAIQSVLDQTYPYFECIVIDDGSTDNTKERVSAFEDERVRYVKTNNQGSAGARNEGIDRAKGDYLAFLDSDDTYFPDTLDYFVEKSRRYPEIDFFYAQLFWEVIQKPTHSHQVDEIDYGSAVSANTMFIKRLPCVRFDPDLRFFEEWYFCMNLKRKLSMMYLEKPVAVASAPTEDALTETNSLEKEYQTIALRYMKHHIHPNATMLCVIEVNHANLDLVFLHLNHLRLFFPEPFSVVFQLGEGLDNTFLGALNALSYPVCSSQSEVHQFLETQSVDFVFHISSWMMPMKGFYLPSEIKSGTQYYPKVQFLRSFKQATFFQTIWRPCPMIITAFTDESQKPESNSRAYLCRKADYLSEGTTKKETYGSILVGVAPTISQTFFLRDAAR